MESLLTLNVGFGLSYSKEYSKVPKRQIWVIIDFQIRNLPQELSQDFLWRTESTPSPTP